MTKREQKLLRVGATAHELGLHPITVRRWIKAGRIQAVPRDREVRVPRGSGRASGGQNRWAIVGPVWQGQEYLETLFACFDVTLTVLEPGEEKTPKQELTRDLSPFRGACRGCARTNN